MIRGISSFDKELYKKCKKELDGKDTKVIILNYKKKYHLKNYEPEFLSYYYSPTLTILRQFLKNLKGKHILEIGYRLPLFLEFLQKRGAIVFGIDIEPYVTNNHSLKLSIDKLPQTFIKQNKGKFHAIFERITLSRLYDGQYFLKTGKTRFENKDRILSNIYELLRPNGILILQDDRGSIFSETQFKKAGFKKILREIPLLFKDKKGKDIGWNVLVAFKKPAR